MSSLGDQADQIIYKIHLAHALLEAQYGELSDIKDQRGMGSTGLEYRHYEDQLSALNVIVDTSLTDSANKLEQALERYDQKHRKIHKGQK